MQPKKNEDKEEDEYIIYWRDYRGRKQSQTIPAAGLEGFTLPKPGGVSEEKGLITQLVTMLKSPLQRKVFYPTLMYQPEYTLTKYILTAVNKSWSREQEDAALFNELPPLLLYDTACDYQAFSNMVKKYIGDIAEHNMGQIFRGKKKVYKLMKDEDLDEDFDSQHVYIHSLGDKCVVYWREGKGSILISEIPLWKGWNKTLSFPLDNKYLIEAIDKYLSETIESQYTTVPPRHLLLHISDVESEKEMIKQFYLQACEHWEDEHDKLLKLARAFDNNKEGQELAEELFGCSIEELHADPLFPYNKKKKTDSPRSALVTHSLVSDTKGKGPEKPKESEEKGSSYKPG